MRNGSRFEGCTVIYYAFYSGRGIILYGNIYFGIVDLKLFFIVVALNTNKQILKFYISTQKL